MNTVSSPSMSELPDDYNWTSAEGLLRLGSLLRPLLPFEPRAFQLYESACILNGIDVVCITATGDGKTALIYIPAMVREDSITVVVEPTNYLESDVAAKLVEKGVSSVVINRDTLGDASRDGRDLWNEVKACRYRVITLAPETLGSEAFRRVVNDPEFRRRWRVFVMDEAHLCDLWGADFRKAFSDVWTIRSRAPEHVAFMALSASVEPGRQTAQVLRCLGFRRGRYHMDRRDCERININIIFRDVQYAYSGYDFRDLDWLVPENMTKAGDVPKRLVFCETIELGHRVTLYLRSLLPAHLKRVSHIVIRHIHSMNCPDCKKDGFAALMETGDERRTSLFVATAVLDQGVNIPRLKAVVVFPRGKTAAAVIQEIGRAVREGDEQGEAIIYVPKGDLQAALEYANSDVDLRLLETHAYLRASASDPSQPAVDESMFDIVFDRTPAAAANASKALRSLPTASVPQKSAAKPGSTKKGTVPKQPAKPTARTAPSASDRQCLSLCLMVAAHARGFCVTRQINIIYGNPGTTHDCGRCSSCMEYPVPLARSLSDSVAAPQSQTSKAKVTATTGSTDENQQATVKDTEVDAVRAADDKELSNASAPLNIAPESVCVPATTPVTWERVLRAPPGIHSGRSDCD
ncbi:hypothetical protein EVJ58_g3507 [Rhodofomes roseus]|uniref:DNA 3'-5' helicase n=1 Tax=Rhodofomes roseus TaxID=34475 RepID=A0A4Y9YMY6_9APHY|nr:hypothetical protein EVJ58_g3507 [Rhodofomes roseus]